MRWFLWPIPAGKDRVVISIILVMEDGNVHDRAMVRELAGYVVPTLDQAIEVAKAILVEGVGLGRI